MPSKEIRARALECFQWAQLADSAAGKKLWLSMAQFWLDRAAKADQFKGKTPYLVEGQYQAEHK